MESVQKRRRGNNGEEEEGKKAPRCKYSPGLALLLGFGCGNDDILEDILTWDFEFAL